MNASTELDLETLFGGPDGLFFGTADDTLWYPAISKLYEGKRALYEAISKLNKAASYVNGTGESPRIDSLASGLEKIADEIEKQIRRMEE